MCDFEGKKFSNEYSDAGFDDVYFDEGGLHVTLKFTLIKRSSEQTRKCMVAVEGGECSRVKY